MFRARTSQLADQ